jgi:beta-glucosidase
MARRRGGTSGVVGVDEGHLPPVERAPAEDQRNAGRRQDPGQPVEDGDLAVIAAPLDWLGVNYYFESTVQVGERAPGNPTHFIGGEDVVELEPAGPTTTMGWGVSPGAFTRLLGWISEQAPGLPLVITENGSAWPDELSEDGAVHDPERTDYLLRHLEAVADAVAAGADVRGYFAWSLLDNYEWARGYAQRFGLVHVDYATQRRTLKASARVYADLLRRHRAANGRPTTA